MKQNFLRKRQFFIYINFNLILVCLLTVATLVTGAFLTSSKTFAADDYDSDSCSLSGTGVDSHVAEIERGNVNSEIGATTLQVVCGDTEGFAIYAIGYTDDTYGKTVLSNSLDSSRDIATGTNITGDSSWAMKLTADPVQAYPVSIENSFESFHVIPDDFTMVAKSTSATDIGQSAVGATLTTTYQVYISPNQAVGTYTGAVKYVLVHPGDADAPIGENRVAVNYHSNESSFDQAGTEDINKVIYETRYEDEYAYVGEPVIMRTSNLDDDGNRNGSYYNGEYFYDVLPVNGTVSFDGASKVRLEITYGLGEGASVSARIGDESVCSMYGCGDITNMDDWSINRSGTVTFVRDGSTAEVWLSFYADSEPDPDYDYGVYVKAYPIYDEPTEGATYGVAEENVFHMVASSGEYSEPVNWEEKWYLEEDSYRYWFNSEEEIIDFIEQRVPDILNTSIDVYSYYPYRIFYNGNGATGGTMSGFSTEIEQLSDNASLAAYNFYKTGYGFAGWSENPNATVGGNYKIYGPNETVLGSSLNFDSSHHDTLYAVWVQSSGTLQNWAGCSALSKNQVIALSDERDNQAYTVAKLADGKCWMTENLRLESANSSDSTKAQGFGGVFVGLAEPESGHFYYDDTTPNSLYNTSNITGSYQTYRFPRYNNDNTKSPNSGIASVNGAVYGYGNYYSWPAAMASTANSPSNTSICPAGWRLPGYSDISSLNSKITANSAVRVMNYPNNFVYSGIYTASIYSRGGSGYYWSNSPSGEISATTYIFGMNSGMNNSWTRYTGQAVRCYLDD